MSELLRTKFIRAIPALLLSLICTISALAADDFLDPRLLNPDSDYDPTPPPPVRGYRALYISGYTAGNAKAFGAILAAIEGTEIDALVIDMRDQPGRVFYPTKLTLFQKSGAVTSVVADPAAMVANLKARGIRPIARIAVFCDDYLSRLDDGEWAVRDGRDGSVWEDQRGFAWLDPFAGGGRRAVVELAKEVAGFGFAEIQFDYVRFPTYGAEDAYFPHWPGGARREDAIVAFLRLAREELTPLGVEISADVFGFSAWNAGANLEGQTIERMLPYIDSLCPMYYPSHFGWNFLRAPDPKTRDRRIMSEGVKIAKKRVGESGVKVIPYLQGFPLGANNWGLNYVREQIEAALGAGADGFIIWNADNVYGTTYKALKIRSGSK